MIRNMFPVLTTSGLASVEINFDLITLLPTLQNNRDPVGKKENGSGFCISIQKYLSPNTFISPFQK